MSNLPRHTRDEMLSAERNIKSEAMSFVKQRDELSNLNSRSVHGMLGFQHVQFSTMIDTATLSIGEMRYL
jgi:hypothetical protein